MAGRDKAISSLQGDFGLYLNLLTVDSYLFAHVYVLHLQERYNVDMVYYTDEIPKVLQDEYQGSDKPLLFLLHGLNTDSNNFAKPAEFQVFPSDT